MNQSISPTTRLSGSLVLPPDKSISHRSVILNSLAKGSAVIKNYSTAADCQATIGCIRELGVDITSTESTNDSSVSVNLQITSPGQSNLSEPMTTLDAQNSGTTMRLLMGLLASAPIFSVITGDNSLRSRPMSRISTPLSLMGANIIGRKNNSLAPLAIKGGGLSGIEYDMPVASAQVKSSLIIAAMFAKGETILQQPSLSRDHTERMLKAMGADISEDDLSIFVKPVSNLKPVDMSIPGDISAGAFWMVAAAAHPNAKIKLENVVMNPGRTGIMDVLRMMGAKISVENDRIDGGEPICDVTVESSEMTGIDIAGEMIPRTIDEIPIIALAACFAKGKTTIRDASELRVKESDRITTTVNELSKLGANIQELPDGLLIEGTGYLSGGNCSSNGDHRLAMTLAIAGTLANETVNISESEAVSVSYPNFWNDLSMIMNS
ncbi:MAG: 3-phosphoshikimate 1-carboxyvinyltransferase [Dehalococcoidia bacterium]|nr:3-phosphoshikimate 1-carboxyvinyltransferase [Dehalococcoidia bacterium]